jgi:3-oxoadipate enol-lactonase
MVTKTVGGVVLEDSTDGKDVVLCIHGLGGSSNNWTPVLAAFEGFRVLRVDLPGSARSPLPAEPLSIASYVKTILGVLDAMEVARVHVVAHSLGTIVAQHLAVEHPARVASLAMFGPLLAPPEAGRPGILARAALAREKGLAGMQEIADTIVKAATSDETKAERPITLALVRESVMRQSPEGYAASCEALAKATPAAIDRITARTLLVTGENDGTGSPAGVKAMGERIVGSKVVILPGSGHWTTFEKPVECLRALREFYAGKEAS